MREIWSLGMYNHNPSSHNTSNTSISVTPPITRQSSENNHSFLYNSPADTAKMLRHDSWQVAGAVFPSNLPQILEIRPSHGTHESIHFGFSIPIAVLFVVAAQAIFRAIDNRAASLKCPLKRIISWFPLKA